MKSNVNPKIVVLFNNLRKVEKEEAKLKRQREGIEKKISAIRSRCTHKEKEQREGTFCYYCTACYKRV